MRRNLSSRPDPEQRVLAELDEVEKRIDQHQLALISRADELVRKKTEQQKNEVYSKLNLKLEELIGTFETGSQKISQKLPKGINKSFGRPGATETERRFFSGMFEKHNTLTERVKSRLQKIKQLAQSYSANKKNQDYTMLVNRITEDILTVDTENERFNTAMQGSLARSSIDQIQNPVPGRLIPILHGRPIREVVPGPDSTEEIVTSGAASHKGMVFDIKTTLAGQMAKGIATLFGLGQYYSRLTDPAPAGSEQTSPVPEQTTDPDAGTGGMSASVSGSLPDAGLLNSVPEQPETTLAATPGSDITLQARIRHFGTCNNHLSFCKPEVTEVVITGKTPGDCGFLGDECLVTSRWQEAGPSGNHAGSSEMPWRRWPLVCKKPGIRTSRP